jgi:hypothetical protein
VCKEKILQHQGAREVSCTVLTLTCEALGVNLNRVSENFSGFRQYIPANRVSRNTSLSTVASFQSHTCFIFIISSIFNRQCTMKLEQRRYMTLYKLQWLGRIEWDGRMTRNDKHSDMKGDGFGPMPRYYPRYIIIELRKTTVTWHPKAGVVKSEQTFTARQRLGKHIPVATNTQGTIVVNTPSKQ